MSEKKWRFAITGLGSIAHFHIRSIRELPNCELAAVCSSSEERAAAVGKQYGVPWYTRHEHMLDEQPIDVLCICTISGRHLEPALAAARKGVHVLTEKPIEISLSRADEMIRACEKAGLQLGCIFQNRFREAYQHMKAAVEQGKIGRLVLGNAYVKWYRDDAYYQSSSWRGTLWGDGGAALINQAIHTIDLLQHLMGPVRGVIGKTATLRHAIEGEDLGLAILSFENGALGTIEGSTAIFPAYPERLEVHGTQGSIVYEGGSIAAWNVPGEQGAHITARADSGASDPMAIDYQYHKHQIRDFVEALEQQRPPLVSGREGRKSLEIIQSIYESSRLGKEIRLS